MSAPTLAALEAALAGRDPVLLADPSLARAAVALVLAGPAPSPRFLLVERARLAGDPWSGHLALPGGRAQAGDRDLRATAERETREEVGLDLGVARFLGRLDDAHGYVQPIAVATFVYHAPDEGAPAASPEIERSAWIDLARLYAPERQDTIVVPWRGEALALPAVRVLDVPGAPVLWGLTYRLIDTLLARAGAPLPNPMPERRA